MRQLLEWSLMHQSGGSFGRGQTRRKETIYESLETLQERYRN